jgi:hypothetical protein
MLNRGFIVQCDDPYPECCRAEKELKQLRAAVDQRDTWLMEGKAAYAALTAERDELRKERDGLAAALLEAWELYHEECSSIDMITAGEHLAATVEKLTGGDEG